MSSNPKGRKTILLACPHCAHEQIEPAAVLSTYCRKCNSHYDVSNGKPVAPSAPSPPVFDEANRNMGLAPSLPETSHHVELRAFSFKPNGTTTTPCERTAEMECLDCGHLHAISSHATSSLCPRCGSYISLKNYALREPRSRQIRTLGDVRIHENGSLTGASITCRNLIVEGELNGTVDCSGDCVIRRSTRILGSLKCRRLLVENKAEVACASGVQAREVVIDGALHADVTCDGRLELARQASLRGDINIARLIINEGAAHRGRVSMVSPGRK